MSLPADVRMLVRQRAQGACEFCGVTEADTGGELTIDHFQPRVRGGTNTPENLLYCCYRCNQYKADYWPTQPTRTYGSPDTSPSSSIYYSLPMGPCIPLRQSGPSRCGGGA
jgi:5-methylcytosine-specific restriction endonuclease McrA